MKTFTSASLLSQIIWRNKASLLWGTMALSIQLICETLLPAILGWNLDHTLERNHIWGLVWSLITLIICFIILSISYRIGAGILMRAIAQENRFLRTHILEHILHWRKANVHFRDGEILSIATNDAYRVAEILDRIPHICAASVSIFFGAIILIMINLYIGIIILCLAPSLVALAHIASPRIALRTESMQENIGLATATATDFIVGLRALQGFSGQWGAMSRYKKVNQRALLSAQSNAKLQQIQSGVSRMLSGVLVIIIAIIGCIFTSHHLIGIGSFIAMIGLAQFIIEPFTSLAQSPSECASIKASSSRVEKILATHFIISDSSNIVPRVIEKTGLVLEGIELIPKNPIELHSPSGEILGIFCTDPHDSQRLEDIFSGSISTHNISGKVYFSQQNIWDRGENIPRTQILVEPHNSDIFSGTILENLFLSTEVDAHFLSQVLHASNVENIVELFGDGIDHLLSERGNTLSGGQRQRISLARALAAQSKLLILRDPTTAVDSVTQKNIAVALIPLRAQPGLNTVIFTHCPTILAQCHRIAFIHHGLLRAVDTHENLQQHNSEYRNYLG